MDDSSRAAGAASLPGPLVSLTLRKVDHPVDELPEYAAGLMEGPRVVALERHVARCPMCRAWVQELSEEVSPEPRPLARVPVRSLKAAGS